MVEPIPSLKAVILVGGVGNRLRPLTDETPKPMVPVLNRPFLEHTIACLRWFGIRDIVLAMHYLPDVIKSFLGDGNQLGVRLVYCYEKEPLGTAGAVKNAADYLEGTFIVLNGDVFTDLNIDDMLASHLRNKAMATISMITVADPSAFGVIETGNDLRVKRFIEKPPRGEETGNSINAGTYILEPEALEQIPDGKHYMFEDGLFPRLLDCGSPVYGYPCDGYWIDVGNPGKYLALNEDLLLGKTASPIAEMAPDGLSLGRNVNIASSARIKPPVLLGDNCRLGRDATVNGPVVIGEGCLLGERTVVENTVIWDGVSIGGGARLSNCIVGSRASIEPGSHFADSVITAKETASFSR